MEFFDILDQNGNKTGDVVERTKAHKQGICHRGIHVWILNSKNQLLLQKRSEDKDICPSQWYVSLAGHIASNESNEQAIKREFLEELGLDIQTDSLKYLYTFHERNTYEKGEIIDDEFDDVYLLKMDLVLEDLILQVEEVEEVRFIDYDNFKSAVKNDDPNLWIHKVGYPLLFNYLDKRLYGIASVDTNKEMTPVIRKAEKSDATQIIEYLNIVGGQSNNLLFGQNSFHMTIEAEERFIESLSNEKASALFIGKMKEEIVCVGSIISSPKERISHVAELAISVKKKYWGKGIGTQLLQTIIAFAKENDQTEILHLGVKADNESAIKLYKKLGFHEIGRHKNFFRIDGIYYDEILMDLFI